jgi:hypothetical protein
MSEEVFHRLAMGFEDGCFSAGSQVDNVFQSDEVSGEDESGHGLLSLFAV